jgi:hypothetical protein
MGLVQGRGKVAGELRVPVRQEASSDFGENVPVRVAVGGGGIVAIGTKA